MHYPEEISLSKVGSTLSKIGGSYQFLCSVFFFLLQNCDLQIDQKEVSVLFQVQTRLAFSWALKSTTWLGEPDRDAPPEANDHRKCGDLRPNRKEKEKMNFCSIHTEAIKKNHKESSKVVLHLRDDRGLPGVCISA